MRRISKQTNGCKMKDLLLLSEERTLLLLSAPDLENAIRNVVSEVLVAEREQNGDIKVSRAAAAKRLHKTPQTLTRWERAGKLHPIRVGRTIYYAEAEVKMIEDGRR